MAVSASSQTKTTRQTRFLDSRARKTSAHSDFTFILFDTLHRESDDLHLHGGYNDFLLSWSYHAHIKNTTKNSLYFYNKIKIL